MNKPLPEWPDDAVLCPPEDREPTPEEEAALEEAAYYEELGRAYDHDRI